MDIKDCLPEHFTVSKELLSNRRPDSAGCRQMLVDQNGFIFNIQIDPNNNVKLLMAYSSYFDFDINFFKNTGQVTAFFVPDESGGGTVYLKKLENGD